MSYAKSLLTRVQFAFFFFQAEDGIRDYKVTGVQTCALPIYRVGAHRVDLRQRGPGRLHHRDPARGLLPVAVVGIVQRRRDDGGPVAWRRQARSRSEERRVGKSVDLGGRRIIKKKKNDSVNKR